ncbi:hypothetical protein FRC12_016213, partial [Ceratobasidium sp. 428]
ATVAKGNRVFTIGTDGRATHGKVTKITKNAKGFNAPWVKWDGQDSEVEMTFDSLKKDTRPAPSTPSDPKGPGPMDIDTRRSRVPDTLDATLIFPESQVLGPIDAGDKKSTIRSIKMDDVYLQSIASTK